MGTVYNGYSLGGISGGGGIEEISSFTWSWSRTAGAQWISADLSNYEWVVLSFIPNATRAAFKIRMYWLIPVGGSNVGAAWLYSESPSSGSYLDHHCLATIYANSTGIWLNNLYYDSTSYLEPQSNTVQLYGIK